MGAALGIATVTCQMALVVLLGLGLPRCWSGGARRSGFLRPRGSAPRGRGPVVGLPGVALRQPDLVEPRAAGVHARGRTAALVLRLAPAPRPRGPPVPAVVPHELLPKFHADSGSDWYGIDRDYSQSPRALTGRSRRRSRCSASAATRWASAGSRFSACRRCCALRGRVRSGVATRSWRRLPCSRSRHGPRSSSRSSCARRRRAIQSRPGTCSASRRRSPSRRCARRAVLAARDGLTLGGSRPDSCRTPSATQACS